MKKGKNKLSIKKAKKIIRKDLALQLHNELKTAVENTGYDVSAVSKALKRAAQKLSRKLSAKTIKKNAKVLRSNAEVLISDAETPDPVTKG